ncbi:MAG: TldD/PmbA family protein [Promethearchaeota archaeon]
MIDVLQKAIETTSDKKVAFADIRTEERITTNMNVTNGSLRDLSQASRSGTVARALVGECWGQASTTDELSHEVLTSLLDSAIKSAKASAKHSRKMFDLSSVRFTEKTRWQTVKENPADVPLTDKLSFAMSLDKALNVSDKIVRRNSAYIDSKRVYRLVNTLGARLEWDELRTLAFVNAVAKEGSKMQYDYNNVAALGGFEVIRNIDVEEFGSRCANGAIAMLSAKKPPSGKMNVIMDGDIAGGIAHEVCGHASEADEVVKKRSFLTGLVGTKIGTDQVTMIDDGTLDGKYGSYPFDNEGIPTSKTMIIKNGVFKGYLHTIETAVQMGVKPTGNARAQDYNRRIFARMTNTYFDKGDWKEEEIIAETKDGVLALKVMSGMEDVVGGGVQVSALKGYIIKNGEKTQLVRSMSLAGKVLEILETVDAVSDNLIFTAGTCGKGEEDYIPVTSGGPYMRAKLILGGS